MPKIIFVILHYLTYEDTIECVESITNNINYKNYEIIIVDNASKNGSYEAIEDKFRYSEKIYIIKSNKNLGFAKGNNIGYKFAKNNLNADFIITINNDTIITERLFLDKIIKKYNSFNFDILGPDIISLKDNCMQNPLKKVIESKSEILKNIIKYLILYFLNITKIEYIKKKFIKNIHNKKICNKETSNKKIHNKEIYNVPLHGACLIFSPSYINNFDYAFYPNTFLYVEEDILYYLSKKYKLKTIYFPEVKIYHKEDSSTDFLLNTEDKKRRFIYINILKSLLKFGVLQLK
ncbi:glycosyltransferase [Clostridium perfringens]|uniref:glycosyltransferase n=1 Tax=Clostridium perfringens TaxID=1502 RepID=UPI0036A20078